MQGSNLFSVTEPCTPLLESTNPTFGILDVDPDSITAPPQFSEEATVNAMRNLQLLAEDLVPHKAADTSDPELQVQVSRELERRRRELIGHVVAERNRLVDAPPSSVISHVPRLKKKKAAPKQKNGPDPIRPPKQSKSRLGAADRLKAADERRADVHRQKQQLIEQKAKERMAKIKVAETDFERRRNKLRVVADSEFQKQQRQYMRLQEQKRKKYEAEQRKRKEQVYKETNRHPKTSFSQLKKELLGQFGSEIKENRPPASIAEIGSRKTSQSLDIGRKSRKKVGESIPRIPGMGARGPIVKLPIAGKGKTKLPVYRR
jgi:hypothetical protein